MVQRMGGFRRKTRYKLQKNQSEKGKISISKFFRAFNEGDSVVLKGDSSVHGGMFHPRYHGKAGIVMGRQGHCYKVLIKDGSMEKMMIVHPIHLKQA